MAVHSSLQVGPAHRVPDAAAPVASQLWDSSKVPQQDNPNYLAYSSASLLPTCKTLNAKVGGFGGNLILSSGETRALCLVIDLWKFPLGFFPVQ